MPRQDVDYLTTLPVNEGDRPPTGPRTVVCFGLPRGGTSMIAGAVLGLGVPMGTNLLNNVEDPDFDIIAHGGPKPDFVRDARAAIKRRNETYDVWGWKCPFAAQYLEDIIEDLRAPLVVYVYRDPIPSALRSKITRDDRLEFVVKRLRAQGRHTMMIAELGCPALLVSYEKATSHPSVFLDELAAFLGVDVPPHRDEIIEFLTPGTYKDPAPLIARLNPADASHG